jgi:hypothetical protein
MSHGDIGIRQTGEQWLIVGSHDVIGPWTLTIRVSPQDSDARMLALPQATPTPAPPTPTATTPPTRLPFTFAGFGTSTDYIHPFRTTTRWRFTASCVNDPADTGSPEYISVYPEQTSDETLSGYARVGSGLDFYCDGHSVSSDAAYPSGLDAGSYGWEIVTAGKWTVTVSARQ